MMIRTDQGGELAKSTKFCTLIKHKYQVGLEMTAGYSSWLNGKAERPIQTASNMIRVGQFDHGLGPQFWCCKMEDTTQKYNAIVHATTKSSPDFLWYGRRPAIWEFRTFGCKVEAKIGKYVKKGDPKTEHGYYLGTAATKSVIRYWTPRDLRDIQYCTTVKIYEPSTYLPNGSLSPGSVLSHGIK